MSELREKFRTDVLRIIQECSAERSVRKAEAIEHHLRIMGWRASDFGHGDHHFYRLVDHALQFHRKAGSIHYHRVLGWRVVWGSSADTDGK
jgi:hypothetical protein